MPGLRLDLKIPAVLLFPSLSVLDPAILTIAEYTYLTNELLSVEWEDMGKDPPDYEW